MTAADVPHEPQGPESTPPLGRRARKAIATRQALFDAGLAAFERSPISFVSILDITEAADVAKGVFYLHFPSKDDYLLALLKYAHDVLIQQMTGALANLPADASRLVAVVTAYEHLSHQRPEVARYWLRMTSYCNDEIGAPGALADIRTDGHCRVASLLYDQSVGPGAPEVARVALLDHLLWFAFNQHWFEREPVLDRPAIVSIARSMVGEV